MYSFTVSRSPLLAATTAVTIVPQDFSNAVCDCEQSIWLLSALHSVNCSASDRHWPSTRERERAATFGCMRFTAARKPLFFEPRDIHPSCPVAAPATAAKNQATMDEACFIVQACF